MRKKTGRRTTVSGQDTLAGRMVVARMRHDWTQENLADASDVTPAAIAKIESGRTLHPRNIDRISKALGVSSSWLLFGQHAMADDVKNASLLDVGVLRQLIEAIRQFASEERINMSSSTEATMIAALYQAIVCGGAPLSKHLIAAIHQAARVR